MRIKNTTNIPIETIQEIHHFIKPSGIANYDIQIKNHKGTKARGVAYSYGCSYNYKKVKPFVNVCIAKENKFKPYFTEERKGYLRYPIGSRIEALVAILAHELRHLWQSCHLNGKVYGSKGRFSERDADAYALHMLREWRRK